MSIAANLTLALREYGYSLRVADGDQVRVFEATPDFRVVQKWDGGTMRTVHQESYAAGWPLNRPELENAAAMAVLRGVQAQGAK